MTSDQKPRLTSLFAGIGGFDLGFDRAGFTTAGQCEIDPHARSVLDRHWPTVPKHDDVTTLRGSTFGPADVVTFGSPCQDLSVAGKRAGLAGERSGLFTEAMRYIREMLEETNGQSPRAAVWENVPGAFSSNGGADFAAVLQSMVGGTVRCPSNGWANAGVAFGPEGAAEWRVLDSQHFGVAQRRRRVFVVYHPGSDRAGQILFERESVRRDSETGRPKGQGAAGAAEGGVGDSGAIGLSGELNAAYELQPTLTHDSPTGGGQKPMVLPRVTPAVTAKWAKGTGGPAGDEAQNLVPVLNDQGGSWCEVSHGVTGTLRAQPKGNHPIVPVAFKIRGGVSVDSDGKGAGKGYLGSENMALTLGTVQDMFLAEPIGVDQGAGDEQSVSVPIAFAQNQRDEVRDLGNRAGALQAEPGMKQQTFLAHAPYAVRRLTPTECERLQGFPDGHTALAADDREIADTHRYRMLGNAVTVNVAEWIGKRLHTILTGAAE